MTVRCRLENFNWPTCDFHEPSGVAKECGVWQPETRKASAREKERISARMGWPRFTGNFGAIAQRAAIVLAVCFVVAALSRKFLEAPALRLKKRFSVGREVLSR